jgi:TPR repeat protein
MLGHCYECDKYRAFEFYKKAAKLGDSQAQYNLAFIYKNGYGTTKDLDKATHWYKNLLTKDMKTLIINYINSQKLDMMIVK